MASRRLLWPLVRRGTRPGFSTGPGEEVDPAVTVQLMIVLATVVIAVVLAPRQR